MVSPEAALTRVICNDDTDQGTRALQVLTNSDGGQRYRHDEGRSEAGRPHRARPTTNSRRRNDAAFVYLDRPRGRCHMGRRAGDRRRAGQDHFVEPTAPIEDDPNLTDKRFLGNPTEPYRRR